MLFRSEKSLRLKISARGNILYISGQEAQRARSVLERLVLIVKDNRIVDNDEIEAAIRLSMDKSEAKINNIFIKTQKKKYYQDHLHKLNILMP